MAFDVDPARVHVGDDLGREGREIPRRARRKAQSVREHAVGEHQLHRSAEIALHEAVHADLRPKRRASAVLRRSAGVVPGSCRGALALGT